MEFHNQVSAYINSNLIGSEITNSYLVCEKDKNDNAKFFVKLDHPLRFRRLPMKQSSNKKVDVFLDGVYTFRKENGNAILIKYSTYVEYYQLFSDGYKRIDGYHFDMDENLQVAHPVFHAQRSQNILTAEIQNYFSDFTLMQTADQTDNDKELRNIRLPTPCMDLFSSVILILADLTVKSDYQDQFLNLLEYSTTRNPMDVEYQRLAKLSTCFTKKELRLGHWYDKVMQTS